MSAASLRSSIEARARSRRTSTRSPSAIAPKRAALKLWVRQFGDGLKVLYFNGQLLQDRGRQREHRLPPSFGQRRAGMPKIVVRLGCQPVTLALDRVFIGHECDYGAFRGLRLSPVRLSCTRVLLGLMARQSPKPPSAHLNACGARGHLIGGPCFLTSAQRAELRRKLAEVAQAVGAVRRRSGVNCKRRPFPHANRFAVRLSPCGDSVTGRQR